VNLRRRGRRLLLLAGAALAACQLAPVAEPGSDAAPAGHSSAAAWAALYTQRAAAGGRLFTIDPRQSSVRILVFRGGRAPGLGHNHVLAAPDFVGYCLLPPSGAGDARFDLEFRLDALELDRPALRAALGPPFAAELTPGDVANTRAHMLGEDNLQASRFPYVRIHGLQVTGEGSAYAARLAVELHGQTREAWVPLTVEGLPGHLAVSGSWVLRQSDFGVRPYSALGGLIAVQDEILLQFRLVAD
jgi:hypothetical protein